MSFPSPAHTVIPSSPSNSLPFGDPILAPHDELKLRSQSADQLTVEATYAPFAVPPRAWAHPDQDERIEVLEGALRVRMGRQEFELRAGDVVAIPRGKSHQVWNEAAEPARVVRRLSSPGRAVDYFAAFNDLHRAAGDGKVGILRSSVLVTEYRDVVRPNPVMRGILSLLGFLGRRRGYRAAAGGPAALA